MNLQFILDSTGQTTGVFIPINDWNNMKRKYNGLEQDELEVPDWHQKVVQQRLEDFNKDQSIALDFEDTLNELENEL